MDLSRKACLYGAILILIACSLASGCICGLSQPGPGVSGNNKTGDLAPAGENPGESLPSPAPAEYVASPSATSTCRPPEFTIHADGGLNHGPGETIRLYGVNTCSDTVYLFVSCTMAPVNGGRTENIRLPVIDRDPVTFVRLKVGQDGSWEYDWTAPPGRTSMLFDLYNLIAVAEPRDKPHLDEASAWDMVTVKISDHLP